MVFKDLEMLNRQATCKKKNAREVIFLNKELSKAFYKKQYQLHNDFQPCK